MNDDLRRKANLFFPELMGISRLEAEDEPDPEQEVEGLSSKTTSDEPGKVWTPASKRIWTSDDEEDFDIAAAMQSAKDPLTGLMRDLKIDDRDLPLAKNYFDFCQNILRLDDPVMPWARQMWTALVLFGEVCPRCSNKKFLKDIMNVPKGMPTEKMVSELQLLEYGICPRCKATKLEFAKSGEMKIYNELVLVWGQRSGKSTSASMMTAYHIHRFLKLPKLGTLIDTMQNSTPLTYSFISLDLGKAINLLWEPFVSIIKDSAWYNDLFALLDFYGKKYGVELYNRKLEFIKFYHKNIHLVPTHPGWEKLRGATRIGASFDELGLFPLPNVSVNELDFDGGLTITNDKKMANADQAHQSVNTSLMTIRKAAAKLFEGGMYHMPTGIMLGVSSPISPRDMVMRLLGMSKVEPTCNTMLGIQLATWDVHPDFNRDSPEIVAAYAKNPEDAERDVGANPPRLQSAYIHRNLLREDVFGPTRNTHTLEYEFSGEEISARVRKVRECYHASILTIDAGHVNNSFTLCSQHFDKKTGQTVTSTVLEVIPSSGLKINFNDMYNNVILPVAKDTNAAVVIADRWNSLDLLYRISADIPGVTAKTFTPMRRHFDSAKALLQEGNARLPFTEIPLEELMELSFESYRKFFLNRPVAHLAAQMITVRDTHVRRPPEKGDGFTDDIFRAWVLGASLIHLPRIRELLDEWEVKMKRTTSAAPAMFVSRSGVNIWPGLR